MQASPFRERLLTSGSSVCSTTAQWWRPGPPAALALFFFGPFVFPNFSREVVYPVRQREGSGPNQRREKMPVGSATLWTRCLYSTITFELKTALCADKLRYILHVYFPPPFSATGAGLCRRAPHPRLCCMPPRPDFVSAPPAPRGIRESSASRTCRARARPRSKRHGGALPTAASASCAARAPW